MFAPRYFSPRYFAPRYWPPNLGGVAPGEPGVVLGGYEYTGLARDFMHGANVVDLMTMTTVQDNAHAGAVVAFTHGAGVTDIMHGASVVDEAYSASADVQEYLATGTSEGYSSTVRDRNPEAE